VISDPEKMQLQENASSIVQSNMLHLGSISSTFYMHVFSYKILESKITKPNVTRKKLLNLLSYEKHARKMLMKSTPYLFLFLSFSHSHTNTHLYKIFLTQTHTLSISHTHFLSPSHRYTNLPASLSLSPSHIHTHFHTFSLSYTHTQTPTHTTMIKNCCQILKICVVSSIRWFGLQSFGEK